jgi:23S rRNA (cytidine1920-2'-O)/16S rRNA (cytidine1409-2'-O)-methyltransferase
LEYSPRSASGAAGTDKFAAFESGGVYEPGQPYPDLGVADVSFISLTKVLPAMWQLLQAPREVVLLVKPQFEVGREKVGKKGVVRDVKVQAEAIAQVMTSAAAIGWGYCGLTASPLLGPAGNIEYLLWLKMESALSYPDLAMLQQVTQGARDWLVKSEE